MMKPSFILATCLSFSFLILSVSGIEAQHSSGRGRLKEKLKASHAAYITQELNLTEAEAQKFWPVYNAYRAEMDALKTDAEQKPVESLTEKEAEELLNVQLEQKTKEVELQKKYVQKLKTVVPARKIVLLWKAEKEYREKVISNLKKRRRGED